ncbi:uncharacterized protein LOC108939029 isoform X2 [Scleropages formosus]|uniref:uncharacterized protein LOC108939029 isoform X2 n=1 Tax=Scleropages formosus TaxID=113540 RepID=UPI000878A0DA|nr:uncharacterized protein LOC108939029 isoform X2 [Scleropages formosus]
MAKKLKQTTHSLHFNLQFCKMCSSRNLIRCMFHPPGHICVYESMNTTQDIFKQHLSPNTTEVTKVFSSSSITEGIKNETSYLYIVYGLVGVGVFGVCLFLFLAWKTKKSKESVILMKYDDQPTQDLDSEPDYVNQMEESGHDYCSVDLHAADEDSASEDDDYVNTNTMIACEAYHSDSDSEPDYENSAYLEKQTN